VKEEEGREDNEKEKEEEEEKKEEKDENKEEKLLGMAGITSRQQCTSDLE
jgi:hypothetical protein